MDNPIFIAENFSRTAELEGYSFDFSLRSLQYEIDRYLVEYYSTTESTRFKVECELTAYIGETIKRLYKGEWTGQYYGNLPECGKNFYTCKVTIGNFEFYPSHFVSYYLSNGVKSGGTFRDYLYGKDYSKNALSDFSAGGLINSIEKQK